MGARKKSSVEKVIELSVPERILAVEAIWDSIIEDPRAVPTTDFQKNELDYRLKVTPKSTGLANWIQVKNRVQKQKK